MGSEGLVMGSGGAPRALVDFFSAAALGALKPRCLDLHTFPFLEQRELITRRSKKGNVCKSKHHGFGALRALVDFFFCSGPGGSVVEVLGFAHISFFGTM